jgi:hypothetical protein
MEIDMVKAGAIAIELRKLADALDTNPEAETVQPTLMFGCWSNKPAFFAAASLVPRPAKKDWGKPEDQYAYLNVTHESEALKVQATIWRSEVCEIVEPARPAVFRCPSILSEAEEAALETA